MCPGRQNDIVNNYLLLGLSVIVVIFVDEHLWKSVQLWYEFAKISGRSDGVIPGSAVAVEDTVGTVKFAALESDCADAEGTDADEEIENYCR